VLLEVKRFLGSGGHLWVKHGLAALLLFLELPVLGKVRRQVCPPGQLLRPPQAHSYTTVSRVISVEPQ
jgi:hypothetical protein